MKTTTRNRCSLLLLAAALSLPAASVAAPKDQPKVKEKQGNIYRGNAQWKQDARAGQRNRNRDDKYYRNRYGRYGARSNGQQEHLDGFVVDDRGECVLFREHRTGQIFALAGNVDDMREGDHIRYVGTHTYDEYCGSGYPTMNVREIKTVWSNARHENAVFDSNRHGSYNRWADRYQDRGRYEQDRGRYDDRYRRDRDDGRYGDDRYGDDRYDDQYYDRDGDRRLITVEGRLDNGRSCPTIRGNNGETYNLTGDLRDFRGGDKVKVFGYLAESSRCGGRTLQVGEIVKR
ncbi:MAG TPA: hypothetical protein VIW92_06320 [Thermoanaerobaculia bacterium]